MSVPAWLRTDRVGDPARPWLWVLVGLFGVVMLVGGLTLDLHGFLEVVTSRTG